MALTKQDWLDLYWSLYYGITMRLEWLWHMLTHPTHKMHWRIDADEECTGDATCETCDAVFVCRAIWSNHFIGHFFCGRFGGHSSSEFSTGWERHNPLTNQMEPCEPSLPWFCMKCGATL